MTTILFQGDSVTDCGRREDPNGLGDGYALAVSQALPGARVLNRGISGNRAKDLAARWQADCLDLYPDGVSILIGINDVWRRYDSNDPTNDAAYEASYRKLLEPLRGTRVLLIQPFLLDISPAVTAMREDLAGKQAVVRRLAEEYGGKFALLDADELFRGAVRNEKKPPAWYAADGVHPTDAGHRVLGEAVAEML